MSWLEKLQILHRLQRLVHSAMLWSFFSRVLRDSTARFVGPSARWSVRRSIHLWALFVPHSKWSVLRKSCLKLNGIGRKWPWFAISLRFWWLGLTTPPLHTGTFHTLTTAANFSYRASQRDGPTDQWLDKVISATEDKCEPPITSMIVVDGLSNSLDFHVQLHLSLAITQIHL